MMGSLNKKELLALIESANSNVARLKNNFSTLTMEAAQVELQKLEAALRDLEERLKSAPE
jgi:hypothetical protein